MMDVSGNTGIPYPKYTSGILCKEHGKAAVSEAGDSKSSEEDHKAFLSDDCAANSGIPLPKDTSGIPLSNNTAGGILCKGDDEAEAASSFFVEAGDGNSSDEDLKSFNTELMSTTLNGCGDRGIPLPNDTIIGTPLPKDTSGILCNGYVEAALSSLDDCLKFIEEDLVKIVFGILHDMILMVALMVYAFLRGMFYLAFSGAKYMVYAFLHGMSYLGFSGAKYRATGLQHKRFDEMYRTYSRSHFVKAFELMALLLVYQIYGATGQNSNTYLIFSFAAWPLVISLLLSPFLFNPGGFEWPMIVEDWDNFKEWMDNYSFSADRSWEFWWDEEQEQHHRLGFFRWLCKIISSFRFVAYRYGLMYLLHLANNDQKIIGFGLAWSWLVIIAAMVILKASALLLVTKETYNLDSSLVIFRLLRLYVIFGSVIFLAVLPYTRVTVDDVFSCLLSFSATGWALVQMGQACSPVVKWLGMWEFVKGLAYGYEYVSGFFVHTTVTLVAYVSDLQRRDLSFSFGAIMELFFQHRWKNRPSQVPQSHLELHLRRNLDRASTNYGLTIPYRNP